MKQEDKILRYVVNELNNRNCLDNEAYLNMFGCKSWDEVAKGIKEKYL